MLGRLQDRPSMLISYAFRSDAAVRMVNSAGVAISSASPPIGIPTDHRSADRRFYPSVVRSLVGVILRFKDRISAKLAFHDPTRYRALVHQAMESAGVSLASPATTHKLRKLDPDGLGIWYLARGGRQPLLADLCRKAIALPGLGPPRAIARALDRAWSGEKTCLFGESTGFDALMAASLIGAGHAATLVAAHLAWPDGAKSLSSAANQLTRTASAVQSAGRAYARVGRSGSPPQ